ncbi:FAD-dependent oxidoreductase, partial [bacterium]|nr:FAD-dependent oxidoreductase [bacterium]
KPVPIPGTEFEIECDTVIVSIGNGANPLLPQATPGLKTNRWGNITADNNSGKTSKKAVWAGGDIVIGAATVILAMGAGRQAARSMHAYMTGEDTSWPSQEA